MYPHIYIFRKKCRVTCGDYRDDYSTVAQRDSWKRLQKHKPLWVDTAEICYESTATCPKDSMCIVAF